MSEKEQVSAIASYLNDKIDVPYFNEGMEQLGLEAVVSSLVSPIPQTYRTMLLSLLVKLVNGDANAADALTEGVAHAYAKVES